MDYQSVSAQYHTINIAVNNNYYIKDLLIDQIYFTTCITEFTEYSGLIRATITIGCDGIYKGSNAHWLNVTNLLTGYVIPFYIPTSMSDGTTINYTTSMLFLNVGWNGTFDEAASQLYPDSDDDTSTKFMNSVGNSVELDIPIAIS